MTCPVTLRRDTTAPSLIERRLRKYEEGESWATTQLDTGAALAMSVLALGTGLVFGLAPALSVRGSGPQAALREEARGTGESGAARRLRGRSSRVRLRCA